MTKPKVIVVNLSTSGSRLGGAVIAAEWHSRFMSDLYPVELWRMWDDDLEFYLDNLKIRQFNTKSSLPKFEKNLPKKVRSFFFKADILEDLKKNTPKILHLQNPLPALFWEEIVKVLSGLGTKIVVSTHGFYEIFHPNYNLNPIEKLLWNQLITRPILRSLKHIDAFISGYPDEENELMKLGVLKHKIHLVPNGVNPFFLESASDEERKKVIEKFKIDVNIPTLLYIGNHTSNKGIDTFLRIASLFTRAANFVVGGKLLNPKDPEDCSNRFPPSPKVNLIFTDFLSLSEQRALYQLSSLLIFPSLADTLPLTILEAMASDLPVIAYSVGGIPFELDNKSGVIVPSNDFETFYKVVNDLLNDGNKRDYLAKNAKLRQESLFSWESAARNTVYLYEKLLLS